MKKNQEDSVDSYENKQTDPLYYILTKVNQTKTNFLQVVLSPQELAEIFWSNGPSLSVIKWLFLDL